MNYRSYVVTSLLVLAYNSSYGTPLNSTSIMPSSNVPVSAYHPKSDANQDEMAAERNDANDSLADANDTLQTGSPTFQDVGGSLKMVPAGSTPATSNTNSLIVNSPPPAIHNPGFPKNVKLIPKGTPGYPDGAVIIPQPHQTELPPANPQPAPSQPRPGVPQSNNTVPARNAGVPQAQSPAGTNSTTGTTTGGQMTQ